MKRSNDRAHLRSPTGRRYGAD